MNNDIVFKNIFLNELCISTIEDMQRNLQNLSDTVDVGDNGEWQFKLNVALESFEGLDLNNLNLESIKNIVYKIQDFVDLIENITSHKQEEEVKIIKDFNFIKEKLNNYFSVIKSDVVLSDIDDVTLENIADFICGDNAEKFPIYRSSFYLTKFFQEIGINVKHDGSTRKNWVLGVLKELSDYDLNKVVLRLVDIKIYKGDKNEWIKAVNSMNDVLFCEDMRLLIRGKNVSIVSNNNYDIENSAIVNEKDQDPVINNSQIHFGVGDNFKKTSLKKTLNISKEWHEKPFGKIFIGVLIILIAAVVTYVFQNNFSFF
ncbi:MAG: hypothetical protein ACOCU8_01385 [Patescibacteria group bacterium]